MVHAVESAGELEPLLARATVIVLGPGLGRDGWARELFEAAFTSGLLMVIDADALNLLAQTPRQLLPTTILTPHAGEAARLLDSSAEAVQGDRTASVLALREGFGGTWVLKGAGSLVASEEGLYRCSHGHPAMASGGMGDVLSGVLGALLAQGMSEDGAARLGVCLHAAAGEAAAAEGGGRGVLALDLLPHARRLLEKVSPCLP